MLSPLVVLALLLCLGVYGQDDIQAEMVFLHPEVGELVPNSAPLTFNIHFYSNVPPALEPTFIFIECNGERILQTERIFQVGADQFSLDIKYLVMCRGGEMSVLATRAVDGWPIRASTSFFVQTDYVHYTNLFFCGLSIFVELLVAVIVFKCFHLDLI